MKVLVLGASGATGRLVVQQLLERNIRTKIVVRKIETVSKDFLNNKILECITGNISEFTLNRYSELVSDCDAVISCLGHNVSFRGMLGKPRMLVTDCIRNICEAIAEGKKEKVKIILMNTTANRNKKINENYSAADKIVLFLLGILPPHRDNIEAAKYLSEKITGKDKKVEWIAVRPDSLINEKKVSRYEITESPKQSPVFNAGKTSRINVSHFMAELLSKDEYWATWKYRMPVIYNAVD